MTLAPLWEKSSARSRIASIVSVEASMISAKIWMSYLVMSDAFRARPKKMGMSFTSSGPRTTGTP